MKYTVTWAHGPQRRSAGTLRGIFVTSQDRVSMEAVVDHVHAEIRLREKKRRNLHSGSQVPDDDTSYRSPNLPSHWVLGNL